MAASWKLAADGLEHILHIQKSLSQMNLQVHHVLSVIAGASGQAIMDAILRSGLASFTSA
jgi:hypothetical protein